jgi:hypothetical protein
MYRSASKTTVVPRERGVGDADDRQGIVVAVDRLADDRRIGAEFASPQAIADHHDRMAAGCHFVGGQQDAAALGAHAEDLKVLPDNDLRQQRGGRVEPMSLAKARSCSRRYW